MSTRRKPLAGAETAQEREILSRSEVRVVAADVLASCANLGDAVRLSPTGWDSDWPSAATHHRDENQPPWTCPECDRPTRVMVQALDGTKIGPARCEACHVSGLPKRRRKGKAAEAMR